MTTDSNTTKTMNPGDTVYSQRGEQAVLVARSGCEFIVRPIYEDDDGEHEGNVETWGTAFRTPPAPKLDAKTKAAEERLQSLQQQVSEMERKQHEFTRDEKTRMERIKRHDALADLDRYLAGEITHYVSVHDYYPTVAIIPLGDTIEDYSSSDGYGLLSLMPSRTWDKRVVFSVYYREPNRNSSNYSRTDKVFPCCGEEAAKAKAAEVLAGYVADQLAQEPTKRRYTEQLIAACAVHGVDVPQSLIDDMRTMERQSLEAQRTKAANALAEIDAKVAALHQTESAQ